MTRLLVTRLLTTCGLALSLAAVALAQPPQSPIDNRQPDPLRGPEVRDRQVPGVAGSFGEPGGDKKRFVNENRLPPRVFRDAMESIMSPDAPDNLRVTDEQRTRYQSWMGDFQKSVGEYMKQHRDELADLRKKAGDAAPGRRPGQGGPNQGGLNQGGPDGQPRPPQGDEMRPPMDEKEVASAREQLQALMSGAPKIEDLYTKIWTELNPDQQKAVDAKIDEFRAQQAKEREENYVKQRTKKKNSPDQPGGQNAAPRPPQGDPQVSAGEVNRPNAQIDPQRRERLMRMFSRLTPEQQDQLLQRLEQRLREEGAPDGDNPPQAPQPKKGNGKGLHAPQGPGQPRPMPMPGDSPPPTPPQPVQPD